MGTVILVRKASWRRVRSTVICGLEIARSYIAQGYEVDWEATEEAARAELRRYAATHRPDADTSGTNDQSREEQNPSASPKEVR